MNKHIFVITRFSLISKNLQKSWLTGKNSFEDYVKNILHNERLKHHFNLFENIALESLVNQKNFDLNENLTFILLTTEKLPKIYKKKLTIYEKKYPWIKVSYLDENCTINDYNNVLIQEIKDKTNRTKAGTLYATVRLDDDDGLSNQFLSKLSQYLDPKFIGFGYSAPRGCVGFLNNDFKYDGFHEYNFMNIALGLSFINYYAYSTQDFHNKYISIYNVGNHINIDKLVPIIVDGSYLAYVRTRHIASDSDSDYLRIAEKKRPVIAATVVSGNISINMDYLNLTQ